MIFVKYLAAFLSIKERQAPMYKTPTKRACPSCGTIARPDREKSWTALSFFGIPLFTWKRMVKETCPACKALIRHKKATFMQSALWFFS